MRRSSAETGGGRGPARRKIVAATNASAAFRTSSGTSQPSPIFVYPEGRWSGRRLGRTATPACGLDSESKADFGMLVSLASIDLRLRLAKSTTSAFGAMYPGSFARSHASAAS